MNGAFFVARRLFLRKRKEQRHGHPLLGASLGIALSLIPLVTVDHVADGMIEGIIGRYRETSTFHFQIHTWALPGQGDWEETARVASTVDGVRTAWV